MKAKNSNENYNYIVTGLMVTAVFVIVGLLYDYFYDLNDDVLMKDILAGVFTGSPEGHNIQMQYPISFVLSLIYRVFRGFDCYGIFLVLCQFASLWTITDFVFRGFEKYRACALCVVTGASLMLSHIAFVQYTFTVALICAAAAVLFADYNDKRATVFVVIAFLIRSEMTCLMLPFVLLVILYRYAERRKERGEFKKNLKTLMVLFVSIGVMVLVNRWGYSQGGWKEFVSFFDSRTSVYDFYQIPDYDENKEFYDSIDLSKSEYELLVNYNFGLDSNIDHEMMGKIAEYAKSIKETTPLTYKVKEVLPLYLYRLRSVHMQKSYEYPMTDAPWNVVTGILYLFVFVSIMTGRKYGKTARDRFFAAFWRLTILFLGRSSLWLYIMVRGRDPIRITHSLYLLEIVVLVVLAEYSLFVGRQEDNRKIHYKASVKKYKYVLCLALLIVCAFFINNQMEITSAEVSGREAYNKAYLELEDYFRAHGDNFYYMDVYSSVSYVDNGYTYSQKMFDNVDNSPANWTLLGGWASKSPAEAGKLEYFNQKVNMDDGILVDNSFVVMDKDSDTKWLSDYYKEFGIDITVTPVEEVAGEFVILEVREVNDPS